VDVPSRPGDVLAQPTRARLFALLSELRRPAPTEELAEQLGLHPNGVRTHLERLHEVGLVSRRSERLARRHPRET
jgi:predicted ArsR family transcriptional regulator